MRYMMFIKHTEDYRNVQVPPGLHEQMGKFIEETAKAGQFVGGAGLQPTDVGKRVRLKGGKISVMDGPFTESKELIAGYVIVAVGSLDEAGRWAERYLETVGADEVDLRELEDREAGRPLPSDGSIERGVPSLPRPPVRE